MLDIKNLENKILGPVVPIPTFFNKNGKQDLASVKNIVEFVIKNGFKTLMLTQGSSSYFLQSEEEIRELAKVVIEQSAGRATVIVGTQSFWWKDRIISFAKYTEKLGADAIMVLNPYFDGSANYSPQNDPDTEQVIFETYEAIGKAVELGVILNGAFSMRLLKRLVALEEVVALKEDAGDYWCQDAMHIIANKIIIIGGGLKWRFLYGYLWGMKSYLTNFARIAPKVTHMFWKSVVDKNLFEAAKIVDKYDNPFLLHVLHHPKGGQAAIQATHEIFGTGPKWMRPPFPSLNSKEMNELKRIFEQMELI